MRLRLFIAPLLVVLAACGGAQNGGTQAPWDSIFEAVPAEATYAFVGDMTNRDARRFRAAMGQSLSDNAVYGPLFDMIAWATGSDFRDPATFDDVGIDLAGDYAVFSTGLAPVMYLRLSDADAFHAFIEDVIDRNPDRSWSRATHAGVDFRQIAFSQGRLQLGVLGNYGVVRLVTGNARLDVDDDTFDSLLRRGARSPLLDTQEVSSVSARRETGESMSMFGLVRTAPLAAIAENLMAFNLDGDIAAHDPEADAFVTEQQRDVCRREAERLTTTFPSLAITGFRDGERPNHARSVAAVHMSTAGAERFAALFPGTVDMVGVDLSGAPLFLSGNVRLQDWIAGFQVDRSLRSCPNLGALTGNIAALLEGNAPAISEITQMISGSMALALYDIELAGFLPRIAAAVQLGSPNPPALVTAMQRIFEGLGGSGTVDDTAVLPTFEYSFFGLRVRLMQTADRVVIAAGEVPTAVTLGLAGNAIGGDADFAAMRINGAALYTMVSELLSSAVDVGAVTPEQVEQFQGAFAQYESIEAIESRAYFDGSDLILDQRATLADPSEGE